MLDLSPCEISSLPNPAAVLSWMESDVNTKAIWMPAWDSSIPA